VNFRELHGRALMRQGFHRGRIIRGAVRPAYYQHSFDWEGALCEVMEDMHAICHASAMFVL
jgi:hypothetical protein